VRFAALHVAQTVLFLTAIFAAPRSLYDRISPQFGQATDQTPFIFTILGQFVDISAALP